MSYATFHSPKYMLTRKVLPLVRSHDGVFLCGIRFAVQLCSVLPILSPLAQPTLFFLRLLYSGSQALRNWSQALGSGLSSCSSIWEDLRDRNGGIWRSKKEKNS